MKNTTFIFALLLFFAVSCKTEPVISDPKTDLENLVEAIEENHTSYTEKDWEDAVAEFERIEDLLDDREYSDEERQEIGRLKGRIAGYMTKAVIQTLKSDLDRVGKELEGGVEEFLKVLVE